MILDIHTHKGLPQPQGVANLEWNAQSESQIAQWPGQLFSLGYHPWGLGDGSAYPFDADLFAAVAADNAVVAIGECGIDIPKGGPLFAQINMFRKMVEISESLRKPLIIHDVKAHDVIVGISKEMRPTQKWVIHAFRGKPTVAEMMLRQEMYLSFGPQFNAETVRMTPIERILAETDDSQVSIEEVISTLSAARGEELTEVLRANTAKFFNL